MYSLYNLLITWEKVRNLFIDHMWSMYSNLKTLLLTDVSVGYAF